MQFRRTQENSYSILYTTENNHLVDKLPSKHMLTRFILYNYRLILCWILVVCWILLWFVFCELLNFIRHLLCVKNSNLVHICSITCCSFLWFFTTSYIHFFPCIDKVMAKHVVLYYDGISRLTVSEEMLPLSAGLHKFLYFVVLSTGIFSGKPYQLSAHLHFCAFEYHAYMIMVLLMLYFKFKNKFIFLMF